VTYQTNNGLSTLKKYSTSKTQDTDDEMSSSYTTESNRNSSAEDNALNSDISPLEVTEFIDNLKANKAAGLDGIEDMEYSYYLICLNCSFCFLQTTLFFCQIQ